MQKTSLHPYRHVPFLVLATWFLGNMAVHFLAPLLPMLAQNLQATPKLAQYVIAFFLAGKSLGMLVYGPMSEVYGRRTFMLLGLVLYMVGSGASIFATEIHWLIFFRLIQGFGVSATLLMGRAIINDCYKNNKAANIFGYLFAAAGLIITCLPILGSLLAGFENWRLSFAVMFFYSAVMFIIMFKYLPETRALEAIKPLSLKTILNDYKTIFKHPMFFGYLMCSALMMAGESAFNTSSAFLMIKTYGISVPVYGAMSTSLLLAHFLGAAVCGKFVVKKGITALSGVGALTLVLSAVFMLACALLGYANPFTIIAAMFVYFFGTGFIMTTAAVGVVQPFPKMIGTAMAFALSLEFMLSALSSFVSSHLGFHTVIPVATLITIVSVLAYAMWYFFIKPHAVVFEKSETEVI